MPQRASFAADLTPTIALSDRAAKVVERWAETRDADEVRAALHRLRSLAATCQALVTDEGDSHYVVIPHPTLQPLVSLLQAEQRNVLAVAFPPFAFVLERGTAPTVFKVRSAKLLSENYDLSMSIAPISLQHRGEAATSKTLIADLIFDLEAALQTAALNEKSNVDEALSILAHVTSAFYVTSKVLQGQTVEAKDIDTNLLEVVLNATFDRSWSRCLKIVGEKVIVTLEIDAQEQHQMPFKVVGVSMT